MCELECSDEVRLVVDTWSGTLSRGLQARCEWMRALAEALRNNPKYIKRVPKIARIADGLSPSMFTYNRCVFRLDCVEAERDTPRRYVLRFAHQPDPSKTPRRLPRGDGKVKKARASRKPKAGQPKRAQPAKVRTPPKKSDSRVADLCDLNKSYNIAKAALGLLATWLCGTLWPQFRNIPSFMKDALRSFRFESVAEMLLEAQFALHGCSNNRLFANSEEAAAQVSNLARLVEAPCRLGFIDELYSFEARRPVVNWNAFPFGEPPEESELRLA